MHHFISVVLTFMFVTQALASSGQIKNYDKQSDLIEGKANRVSISSQGEIMLALKGMPIFESGRPFIWDMEIDSKGNVFIATGDRACIYRIPPDGSAKMIAQWNDVEVYALGLDQQGNCYAGTSPDGKIYRVFSDKPAQLWADIDAKYIWDISFDQRNRCYIATGDSGAIYVLEQKASPKLLFRSSETHIRCLSWDNSGRLLAGSYPHGYIYRFDRSEQPMVIYDAPYQEIHQLCCNGQGQIYAAGMGQDLLAKQDSEPAFSDSFVILGESRGDKDTKSTSGAKKDSGPASGIIKIQPDGLIKDIWQSAWGAVQSIALLPNGTLLVGTSDQGRLYQLNEQDAISFLMSTSASHVVRLKNSANGKTYIATSNLGNVYQLSTNYESQGSYESTVFDAKISSFWGKIQYEATVPSGCSFLFYTRSGNTEQTNNTWSPWAELASGDNIASPEARFLQWKVVLNTTNPTRTPTVNRISISYLQNNIAPELISITIDPVQPAKRQELGSLQEPGISEFAMEEEIFVEPGPAMRTIPSAGMRRALPDGYRRLSWQARDQNNDKLTFELYIQSKDEPTWRLLKAQLNQNWHVWDSRLMPDGMYRFKLVGDDRSSNPVQSAKKSEKLSDWFLIDNTGPYLDAVRVKKVPGDSIQISFAINDAWSPIRTVEISLDMQNWLTILPIDRVNDTRRENFIHRIAATQPRPNSIVVKAKDAAENISYSRIKLEE